MIEWRKMTCFFWRKLKRESLDNVCWHSCLLYKLCWSGLCSDLTTSSSWIVWQALEDAQIFAHHAFDEDFFFGGGRVGAKTRGKLAHWRCHSRCDVLCQHEGFEATRRRGRTRIRGAIETGMRLVPGMRNQRKPTIHLQTRKILEDKYIYHYIYKINPWTWSFICRSPGRATPLTGAGCYACQSWERCGRGSKCVLVPLPSFRASCNSVVSRSTESADFENFTV